MFPNPTNSQPPQDRSLHCGLSTGMITSTATLLEIILRLSSSTSSLFKWIHSTLTRLLKFPRRSELPLTLFEWSYIGLSGDANQRNQDDQSYDKIWGSLAVLLGEHGFTLFRRGSRGNQEASEYPAPSNYIYYSPNRFSMDRVRRFRAPHGTYHSGRKGNRHYAIRVMSAGGQGLDHLEIMRILSNTVPDNLHSNYHILPMVEEIVYQDITLGVFPLAFGNLQEILLPTYTNCTLEDALHLIMQALEGIMYIHGKNIAHRDLYTDNFLVDFFPASTQGQHWARPRVYLSDFETAVSFPEGSEPSERMITGFPFRNFYVYSRDPCAPELLTSETQAYCPFQLDIFQFGIHLDRFLKTTGFEELDSLWAPFISQNPQDRPKPHDLYAKLTSFINKTRPMDLQRTWTFVQPPVVFKGAKVA